jgi:hypothetical protein
MHQCSVAEDYAMADIVTDGRIIMGVGRGYHTREVETFGAPLLDAEKNRELFETGVFLGSGKGTVENTGAICYGDPESAFHGRAT